MRDPASNARVCRRREREAVIERRGNSNAKKSRDHGTASTTRERRSAATPCLVAAQSSSDACCQSGGNDPDLAAGSATLSAFTARRGLVAAAPIGKALQVPADVRERRAQRVSERASQLGDVALHDGLGPRYPGRQIPGRSPRPAAGALPLPPGRFPPARYSFSLSLRRSKRSATSSHAFFVSVRRPLLGSSASLRGRFCPAKSRTSLP